MPHLEKNWEYFTNLWIRPGIGTKACDLAITLPRNPRVHSDQRNALYSLEIHHYERDPQIFLKGLQSGG